MADITFTGTALDTNSRTSGVFTIPEFKSSSEKIMTAVVYALKNTITKAGGYYNDIGDVVAEWQSPEEYHNYPAFLATWGDDAFTNTVSGGNSLGGYNCIADLIIVAYLHERENMRIAKDRIKHDVLKYFGSNVQLPDSDGNVTAFSAVVQRATPWGGKEEKPRGGYEFLVKVYYRFELTNPAQSF